MNRRERRGAHRDKLVQVNLRDIKMPHELSIEEVRVMIQDRLTMNLLHTGHPFHHQTANMAIVDTDPTLEYYFSRLPPEDAAQTRAIWTKERSHAKPAIPVNRRYYGFDPYEKH